MYIPTATSLLMRKSRVCSNPPQSVLTKILGNSTSVYKPPAQKELKRSDVIVTSSQKRQELREKQQLKDEMAKKKAKRAEDMARKKAEKAELKKKKEELKDQKEELKAKMNAKPSKPSKETGFLYDVSLMCFHFTQ